MRKMLWLIPALHPAAYSADGPAAEDISAADASEWQGITFQ